MAPKKPGTNRVEGKVFESAERGVSLYYEVDGPSRKEWQGDKEEILFMLLGSAADLRKTADQQYINQAVGLFKVITYDHRNTGKSTIRDEPVTMEDYADDAAALIEFVCSDSIPVYVIGVSFGGMVAQHLALRHPHLIKKLVLCCCATGGEGGMSYPIHDWYEPHVTVEARVNKRLSAANSDRDEKWKEANKTEYAMVSSILSRDEKIGATDELRSEGILRQLEARKKHDTYDSIHLLNAMDVLVLGSGKDNITPVALSETLASKIGDNCDSKLDFDWGHPFIAADVDAMPYVNEWLRKPLRKLPVLRTCTEKSMQKAELASTEKVQAWKVVGGADKGGIIVRAGQETSSDQQADRLSHGALVSQLQLKGERLNYKLLKGTGPHEGWISIKLKDKDLVIRTDELP